MYRTDSAARQRSGKNPTTSPKGTAIVTLSGVTKTFTQWQRDNTGLGVMKNLLKPEKRIVTALDNVSFEVNKGEFVAYAGPNGAGKSTTMKLLSGMLQPTSGNISVMSLTPQKHRRAIMRDLGVLFGNRTELWWDHPIIQSFEWKKVVWDIPDRLYRDNLAMVTELLDIGDLLKTFARELSLGQRMRADLAMLLLHSPTLILLDEPTLGLDIMAKRQMIGFLKELNKKAGTTIIVTSHDMDDLEEMAQRILLISNGRIAFDGDFTALRDELGCTKKAIVCFKDGSRNEVNYQDTGKLLRELSELDGIADVTFSQTSLEEGMANLYAKWKETR